MFVCSKIALINREIYKNYTSIIQKIPFKIFITVIRRYYIHSSVRSSFHPHIIPKPNIIPKFLSQRMVYKMYRIRGFYSNLAIPGNPTQYLLWCARSVQEMEMEFVNIHKLSDLHCSSFHTILPTLLDFVVSQIFDVENFWKNKQFNFRPYHIVVRKS